MHRSTIQPRGISEDCNHDEHEMKLIRNFSLLVFLPEDVLPPLSLSCHTLVHGMQYPDKLLINGRNAP
jgi:hypothetical protein